MIALRLACVVLLVAQGSHARNFALFHSDVAASNHDGLSYFSEEKQSHAYHTNLRSSVVVKAQTTNPNTGQGQGKEEGEKNKNNGNKNGGNKKNGNKNGGNKNGGNMNGGNKNGGNKNQGGGNKNQGGGGNKNNMNGGNKNHGGGNKNNMNGGNKNGGNKNGGQKQKQENAVSENRNLRGSPEAEEMPANLSFDFIVAGFPKCGTTTLLKAFAAHDETDMAESEKCVIASPGQSDAIVHKKLDETLEELSKERHVKRAFKCPTTMYNYKSIVRMEKHSPNAKFVVGMRHPVKMLQSFYNYRITEIHERGLDEEIPLLEEVLAADEPWKGVSIESTRFELFLMQMGKTRMTPEQQQDLVGKKYELAIKPTNFTVFLYTVDQLEDDNEERTGELRRVMQEYLGLSKPIQPFGHENKNHATGDAGHKETINICDDKWRDLRATLVMQGAKTAAWLREQFIHSPDVVVANKDHFVETLNSWGTDPCTARTAQS